MRTERDSGRAQAKDGSHAQRDECRPAAWNSAIIEHIFYSSKGRQETVVIFSGVRVFGVIRVPKQLFVTPCLRGEDVLCG